MSRGDWLRELEAELNSPEMLQAIAEEREASQPLNQIRELHGEDWMDTEQADWEAGR